MKKEKYRCEINNPRILLYGPEIAGHYAYLSIGFKRLGIRCDLATTDHKTFQYGGDRISINIQEKCIKYINKIFLGSRMKRFLLNTFEKATSLILVKKIFNFLSLLFVALKYDCIFFCFGKSFYTNSKLEFYIYRLFGVRTIFTFHGSDARPKYINAVYYPPSILHHINWKEMANEVKTQKTRLKLIEKYADLILAAPAGTHFLTRKVINISLLGNPLGINIESSSLKSALMRLSAPLSIEYSQDQIVRILHCPSAPESKGSFVIKQIIENLKLKGLPIKYYEFTGVTNDIIIEAIKNCDLVIDSLWNDSPGGTFPSEAGYFGKPVIIGGYFKEISDHLYSKDIMPPYIYVHPDDFEDTVIKYVLDKKLRIESGRNLQKFIMQHRNIESIAENYYNLIVGKIPKEFWLMPKEIKYTFGYGASETHIKKLIRGLVEHCGLDALQLNNRPTLKDAFIKFAQLENFNN